MTAKLESENDKLRRRCAAGLADLVFIRYRRKALSLQDRAHDHEGRIVDGFCRLITRAAVGGMAEVWLAEVLGSTAPEGERTSRIAIKRIRPELSSDPAFHEMFADEGKITGWLDHPHVVRVERAGIDAVGPYIALEWVEGATLRDLIFARDELLPVQVVVRAALDALSGMAAAHGYVIRRNGTRSIRAPVIHRDISPENILVSMTGEAKLADFGLARATSSARTHAGGKRRGKLRYTPPEVLSGRPFGTRGDVYAMGVTLWEAFSGRDMFPERVTDGDTARAMRVGARVGIATVRSDLPAAIADVVDRALRIDPSERYSCAVVMYEALERAVQSSGLELSRQAVCEWVRIAREAFDLNAVENPGALVA
jgi:eukaryotic-like serine/threonine-protein kinase